MATTRNDLELHVGTTADSRGLKQAADELDKTKRSSDHLQHSFDESGKSSHSLDAELDKLREHLKNLEVEFAHTGQTSLFKAIGKDRTMIRNVERIKNDLMDVAEEATRAGAAAGGFFAEIGKDLASLADVGGPELKAALTAGVAVVAAELAPLIGGAIGGAISSVTAIAGIAAGLLAATRSSAVQAAMKTFGDDFGAELDHIGGAFVGPFQNALKILRDDLHAIDLASIFAEAAPAVDDLAHSVGDFLKALGPGLDKTLQRSEPIIHQLDLGLTGLGQSLGYFLDTVSASPGDLQAFRQFLDGTSVAIMALGNVVAHLGETWHKLNHYWANFYHFIGGLAKAAGDIGGVGTAFNQMGDSLDDYDNIGARAIPTVKTLSMAINDASAGTQSFGEAAELAKLATGSLAGALSTTQQAFLGFMGANINAEEALDNFAASVKENGRSLDVHGEKGRSNARTLQQFAQAATDAAQKTYDQTHSVAAAQKVYEGYRAELYKMAIRLGYTRAEAQKLVNTWLALAALPRTIVQTVITRHVVTGGGTYDSGDATHQHRPHRAMGGLVAAGQAYTVGERGWETFVPSQNGMIIPHGAVPGGRQRVELTLRVVHESPDGRVMRTELISDALGRGKSSATVAAAYP